MEETSLLVKILVAIVILHLIAGFGYMIYKLSPREGDDDVDDDEEK